MLNLIAIIKVVYYVCKMRSNYTGMKLVVAILNKKINKQTKQEKIFNDVVKLVPHTTSKDVQVISSR